MQACEAHEVAIRSMHFINPSFAALSSTSEETLGQRPKHEAVFTDWNAGAELPHYRGRASV